MSDDRVRAFIKAFNDLEGMAHEDSVLDEPKTSLIEDTRQLFYDRASEALIKLPLFKEDRMAIMEILDKVRRGEDATPPEKVVTGDTMPLNRGTITTIYHNPTKAYYEAVILEEVQRS